MLIFLRCTTELGRLSVWRVGHLLTLTPEFSRQRSNAKDGTFRTPGDGLRARGSLLPQPLKKKKKKKGRKRERGERRDRERERDGQRDSYRQRKIKRRVHARDLIAKLEAVLSSEE